MYVAAFPNKPEDSLKDPHNGSLPKYVSVDASNGVARAVLEHVNECYCGNLTADQQEWARSRLALYPFDRFSDATVGTAPQVLAYRTIPTTYDISNEDKCFPTPGQEVVIARAKEELGVEFKQVRVKASHSAVISMPSTVANAIERSYAVSCR